MRTPPSPGPSWPSPPGPLLRLDSFDPQRGGRCFAFSDLRRIVRADQVEEVIPALRALEAEVARGLHAAGYIGYEAAPAFDPALVVRSPPSSRPLLPLLWFGTWGARQEVQPLPASGDREFTLEEWEADTGEAEYRARLGRIREWIVAGDSYQVNFTLRLRAAFRGDDLAFYARLCRAAGAAYCAYLRFDDFSILSASPELFFRWDEGGQLELRPMKGTRPRGRWVAEDRALAAELLASAKERAENLMIVDLLRNDAGRISRAGSVRVPRLFEVERYPTVHQLTSTIRSQTLPDATLTDVLRALLPSGSVTGAPKIRTMEIIAELENSPRGVYCGAIGFVSPAEAVFNVAIRTLVLDHRTGVAELGVGGGITYDSEVDAEYRECFAKAAFVRRQPDDFELLETMLYEPEKGFFLLDLHLARLQGSAEYFGFRYDAERIRRWLTNAVSGILRDAPYLGVEHRAPGPHPPSPSPACGRGGAERGTSEAGVRADEARENAELHAAPGPAAYRVRLLLGREGKIRTEYHPLPPSPSPLRVCLAEEPVDSRDPFLYHKTTRREVYDSRRATHPHCDEVLLRNERGELTEATTANLVVCREGRAWTPPLASGLLPGVYREQLLGSGRIEERILRPEDLAGADGVYLVNSLRKWRKAVLVS